MKMYFILNRLKIRAWGGGAYDPFPPSTVSKYKVEAYICYRSCFFFFDITVWIF